MPSCPPAPPPSESQKIVSFSQMLLVAISAALLLTSAGDRGGAGFVDDWLKSVASGSTVPVAIQLCKLRPASTGPPTPTPLSACTMNGPWKYLRNKDTYTVVQPDPAHDGAFSIASNVSSDPWHHAAGRYLPRPAPPSAAARMPARCLGGMVRISMKYRREEPHRAELIRTCKIMTTSLFTNRYRRSSRQLTMLRLISIVRNQSTSLSRTE